MGKVALVVEDDRDIRENMAEFLESEGYEMQAAANGQEALDLLAVGPLPVVILLDLMMPVMDGFKFREEQEKNPKIAQIPVVLLTADAQAESSKIKLGAVALIRKPIDIEILARVLKRF